MARVINGFILAAGFGERLQPITNHIPKPLIPLLGKPLLETIVEKMFSLESDLFRMDRIGINMHHKKEAIIQWAEDSRFHERITLFPENPILETGGALKNAEPFLKGSHFLVHNGDIFSDIDPSALIEHHLSEGNLATLAIHDFPAFNNVALREDGLLKGVGRSHAADPSLRMRAFTGIAVYSDEFLEFLPQGPSGVVDAWLKAASAGHRIGSFDVTGYLWSDIGSPASYVSALVRELKQKGDSVHIDETTRGCTGVSMGGLVVVEKECSMGQASSLRNCIVMPGVKINDGASYENCIVGPDYSIKVDESSFATITGNGILIGTGGSDRSYFRVRRDEGNIVFMQCGPQDPDFERHMEYTAFFSKFGIPVPALLSSVPLEKSAYFEDLGDTSLYSWLKCPRTSSEIERTYRRVLDILVLLHGRASDNVEDCPLLASRIFDYSYLRWETGYFIERFVKEFMKSDIPDEVALDREFHTLAALTDSLHKRIIHRDFQSQNIMMTKGGVPKVIDFQGARMAPPAYDIASILYDPYAPMREDMREGLMEYYTGSMAENAASWFRTGDFMDSLLYCRLQRHMQALGAYGFLSQAKGKRYFLKYVPEGLRLLKKETETAKNYLPHLHNLVKSL